MLAKASPLKARRSLVSCAEYLGSKTFKTTSFAIRFWLVLIDLLKNEHVEALVLTIISMLQQLITLLKTKEVQSIIAQSLKLAASEPVAKLMVGITKCCKSLFFILKTPEIAKFQQLSLLSFVQRVEILKKSDFQIRKLENSKITKMAIRLVNRQIWELLEDEATRNEENTENQDNPENPLSKQPGMSTMDTIREGYDRENGPNGTSEDDDHEEDHFGDHIHNGSGDEMDCALQSEHDALILDEEKECIHGSPEPNLNGKGANGSTYYSPYRAWNSIASMTSIFGAYDRESDDGDESAEDELKNEMNGDELDVSRSGRHRSISPLSQSRSHPLYRNEVNQRMEVMEHEPIAIDRRAHKISDSLKSARQQRQRSQSMTEATLLQRPRRSRRKLAFDRKVNASTPVSRECTPNKVHREKREHTVDTVHSECRINHGFMGNVNAISVDRTESKTVSIDDWVLLIQHIDDLEDGGDISINEGDELRKLAMEQKMSLLIIYKCYQLKRARFIRYARNILREQDDAKLKHKVQPQIMQSNANNMPISESLNTVKSPAQNVEEILIDEKDQSAETALKSARGDGQNGNLKREGSG